MLESISQETEYSIKTNWLNLNVLGEKNRQMRHKADSPYVLQRRTGLRNKY